MSAGRGVVDRVAVERTPTDWYSWEVREDKFLAADGPKNLALSHFDDAERVCSVGTPRA